MRPRLATFAAVALAWPASASTLSQSARVPAGPQAAHIHDLWLVMLAVCAVVQVAVVAATLAAVLRGRRADGQTPADVDALGRDERAVRRVVQGAVTLTVVTLVALIGASLYADRAIARLPLADALHVELTGHQWWWEARYDDPQPSRVFTTANELRLPVGRPVVLTLKSSDVIHSVWIPSLAGKKDMIPGRTAVLTLRADETGVFRGLCAEFCGYQHAKMALDAVAVSPDEFERWAERQRRPAPAPADPAAAHGRALFERGTCAMCHAVSGTSAHGRTGPDLTHVASRRTLGAGVLENTRANRAAWIEDPQKFKPGNRMPAHALSRPDLDALLAYLDTLE